MTDAERLAELEHRLDELASVNAKLSSDREQYRKLYLEMLERCRRLELGLRGQKAERTPVDEAQLSMQLLSSLLGQGELASAVEDEVEPATESAEYDDGDDEQAPEAKPRPEKKPRRKPLPEHLPRLELELVPPEVVAEGRDAFEVIGEEIVETIERRPAAMLVVLTRRPKFVRRDRERNAPTEVFVAPPVDLPIERGRAGPGMLADSVVRRFGDAQPMHRLEKIYGRDGLEIAKSTICGWHQSLMMLCRPLIAAMWKDAKERAPYLCVDATGVLVQAKEKCRNGHFWVVVAPALHVLFGYSARHNAAAVDALLEGYRGFLVADAHAVYDHLYADGDVTEVGCWAHARRYFFKALLSDPERAKAALVQLGALFALERKFADESAKRRKALRLKKSQPIVAAFLKWCDDVALEALDDTPIAKAVGYVRNQRVALQAFLKDGRLPIHNNISELQLRRQAVGRKNWLFIGNDDAGEVNTTFVSLIASCEMHGIEPYGYLRDLFTLLPSWPKSRVLDLAPAYWAKTVQQPDAAERLATNVFRRVAVGEFDEHPESE